jgi:hypothetical protein
VVFQYLGIDVAEDGLAGGFEDDGRGDLGLQGFDPARETDTPPIARLQAGKAHLGAGCREIVALGLAVFQKVGGQYRTDLVAARIAPEVVTQTVAQKARLRVGATGPEVGPEDVSLL